MTHRLAIQGYCPGAIGRIVELHGTYYAQQWGFGVFFEAKVAAELGQFLAQFDPKLDGFWIAQCCGDVVGSIAIAADKDPPGSARLRWFIVSPEHQCLGIGHQLMSAAMAFCRSAGHRRAYLTTFAGLDAARRLYEQHGFALQQQQRGTHWGNEVDEQLFVAEM